jgi:phosphatidylinositol alpha-mannosyltransferase
MAAGVPVVASAIPGYRSVLTNGMEGLLVEPGDELAIAGAITGLLGDPLRRTRMAAEGRLTAQGYDWSIVAQQILDYYQELVESRSGTPNKRRRKGPSLEIKVRPSVKI